MPHAKKHPASRQRRWSREGEELLGTKSDQLLARKLNRTVTAVAARRQHLGITLFKPWRRVDDKLLGLRPDDQVAMLLKLPRHQVA
jgi:hypothetical protein